MIDPGSLSMEGIRRAMDAGHNTMYTARLRYVGDTPVLGDAEIMFTVTCRRGHLTLAQINGLTAGFPNYEVTEFINLGPCQPILDEALAQLATKEN